MNSESLALKSDVLRRLQTVLPDRNLYDLARDFAVTVKRNENLNKGWVGQTIERAAQLRTNSVASRDGADFELKSTSLVPRGDTWAPQESLRITSLNPQSILEETFETSILWNKLSSLIVVGCHHVSPDDCRVVKISGVDVTDPELVSGIRTFWEDVQSTVCSGDILHHYNLGSADDLVELRPTGTGKEESLCPITGEKFPARAFYGTKRLIRRILQLS